MAKKIPTNMEELNEMLRGILGTESLESIRKSVKASLQSEDFKQRVQERRELMEKEERTKEEAPWFGKTGLSDDLERELPRYLRREFGESLFDEGSFKAHQLEYLGAVKRRAQLVHYWKINRDSCEGTTSYAYIEVEPDASSCMGWGDRDPPEKLLK